MSAASLKQKLLSAVIVSLIAMASSVSAPAQSSKTMAPSKPVAPKRSSVYEDREIRVTIPLGWGALSDAEIKNSAGLLGNSVSQAKGKLILQKGGYILGIAYDTGHASGVEGGRFIEIFNIPWPEVDDTWDCSLYLSGDPQPASRILMFTNVVVDPNNSGIGEHCGVKIDSRAWGDENGAIRRWFGGYFRTAEGGYFFDSRGDGCGQKAYTFTFQAERPDRLPNFNDRALKKMIQEAINIVDSIQYKRCAPY